MKTKAFTITIALITVAAILAGCATVQKIVTPTRIEAVTALGAYVGAKAAIAKGHRAEIEQSLAGLLAIQASGKADLPAVIAAIEQAGVAISSMDEGELIIQSGVLLFADLWAGTAQVALDDARVKAAMAGVIRGFDLALNWKAGTRTDVTLMSLQEQAAATRGR